MSIRFNCPNCGHGIVTKDEYAGKRGRCEKCNKKVEIPAATAIKATTSPVRRVAPEVLTPTRVEPTEIDCPFCGELVKQAAKKCRHCGEILDVTMRAASERTSAPASISINNVLTQTTIVGSGKRWSRLVAMVLSFVIPGLGQLYKGQFINAVVWFVVVVAGYAAFVAPGIVLHVCCVIGAGMGRND